MLERAAFTIALAVGLLATSLIATGAQKGEKMYRIGVLSTTWGATSPVLQLFRERLKELGYVEGQNLAIEVRSGDGRNDRLPLLASELVSHRVDVILTGGPYALEAAKAATTSIPVVFAGVGANLEATRGGNLTGVAEELVESNTKRMAVLKEAIPNLRRLAVLANPDNYGTKAYLERSREWAKVEGVTLYVYEVRDLNDIAPAFEQMTGENVQAVAAYTDSILFGQRERIVQLALKNRLPGTYPYREWVSAGGLLSYGPNLAKILRGPVPMMVDKILKGAKASDLPVEQPRLELFINLKTAKAIGVAIPPSLLSRADEVIE